MEKSNKYITRFGNLAEMGIFREYLISGITANEKVLNYCLMVDNLDKTLPLGVSNYFKFTELKNDEAI